MCMTFCVHETAVTVQHHRKFLILHSHHSAQRDALKDVYYGLIIFVSFLFLFLKFWKFSLKFSLKIFIENFQSALSFTWRTLKVPKILRNAHWPGTGLFPEPPMILLSFFLFLYFFFAFYSDSTDEGSNPERIGGYSTYHTLSIASVNHKILFELKFIFSL